MHVVFVWNFGKIKSLFFYALEFTGVKNKTENISVVIVLFEKVVSKILETIVKVFFILFVLNLRTKYHFPSGLFIRSKIMFLKS